MDTAAPHAESDSSLKTFFKAFGAVSKFAAGAGSFALGVAFLGGLPLVSALVFGGVALAAGGRQMYQAAKTMAGKDEAKPGWKTRLAHAADSLGMGWTGALAFSIGGFAMAMGSTAVLPAVLGMGGMLMMAVGTAQLATHAYTAIRDTVKYVKESKAAKAGSPLPAPEPTAASKLGALQAQPGFEKAASPEATVSAPMPKPVNVPTPPRP